MRKFYFVFILFAISTSCQSQPTLPIEPEIETIESTSLMNTFKCEDLTILANKKNFALKNLAALKAQQKCADFKFDTKTLSDFERNLYSSEMGTISAETIAKVTTELSIKDLQTSLKKEKDFEAKFKTFKQLRTKQKRAQLRADYLLTTEKMHKWSLDYLNRHKKLARAQEIVVEASQIAGRTFWTEDSTEKSRKLIKNTLKLVENKVSCAELYFLLGRISEEEKQNEQALEFYQKAENDIVKFSAANLSFNIGRLLWLRAWIPYKDSKFGEAAEAFERVASAATDITEKSRAQFYRAKSLRSLGKTEEATALFELIMQQDFFGYYGLLSYREVGKKLPALKNVKAPKAQEFDLQLTFLPTDKKEIYTELIKYGEYNLAEKAIPLSARTQMEEINMSLSMAKNKKYMPLFRIFSKLSNDDKLSVFIAFPEFIFPQPYREHVDKMAEKTNLPRSLIYSIMKQESAFNEKARSGADAYGLMQVIPKLAKHLAKKFEIPYYKTQDLYDPQINIQLGTHELMEQVRRQNGQLTFVAAAYNAGPNALAGWLKTRKRADILEFIEDIPYEETKTYVKLIARNTLFYERISNRDAEFDFPQEFLKQTQ